MQEVSLMKARKDKKGIRFSALKRRILKHIWLVRSFLIGAILVAILLFFLILRALTTAIGGTDYFILASSFIFPQSQLIKESGGRTNILIMGKGGAGHEAPDLTDTMIFVSVPHNDSDIDLISIPRDIWLPDLKAKINSAYYWGNQKEVGGGITLAKSEVESVVGKPVHYGVVVDFSVFEKVVNIIGGINVDVERSFIDKKYPIAGKENDLCNGDPEYKCRYETIEFKGGTRFMDGETALKFVRSRNAEGDEGTDLARSARQEKVISAIKEKILTKDILLNPSKLKALKKVFLENIETDINSAEASSLARYTFNSRASLISFVMPEEFLEVAPKSPVYDNLYVFIPKSGDWQSFHDWVNEKLE